MLLGGPTVHSMTPAVGNASEFLHVHVDHVAGAGPLVADDLHLAHVLAGHIQVAKTADATAHLRGQWCITVVHEGPPLPRRDAWSLHIGAGGLSLCQPLGISAHNLTG